MKRSVYQGGLGALVALGIAAALVATLAVGACTPGERVGGAPAAPSPAAVSWDPAALEAAMPGLVGWNVGDSGAGALVALSANASPTVVWKPPSAEGGSQQPLAIDPDGPQMLCARWDDATGTVRSLLLLNANGSAEELPLPEGYEGVQGATFVDGRPLVVAYRAAPEDFVSAIGTFSNDGAWQDMSLAGTLPDYHFVERVSAIPGTGAVAVVLKTPGGPGERDDEALVLARPNGAVLECYTPAFGDDALPQCAPLRGVEGVAYPRQRIDGDSVYCDLVDVRWTGDGWRERVLLESGDISNGLETGTAVAVDAAGAYWLRSAGVGVHPVGTRLGRVDPATLLYTTSNTSLDEIGWFVWLESTSG